MRAVTLEACGRGIWDQVGPLPLLSPLPMPALLLRPSLGLTIPSAVLLGWLPVRKTNLALWQTKNKIYSDHLQWCWADCLYLKYASSLLTTITQNMTRTQDILATLISPVVQWYILSLSLLIHDDNRFAIICE